MKIHEVDDPIIFTTSTIKLCYAFQFLNHLITFQLKMLNFKNNYPQRNNFVVNIGVMVFVHTICKILY